MPIISVLLGYIFFKEKLSILQIISLILIIFSIILLDTLSIDKIHEEIKYELNQAVKFAKSSPDPKILNMKKYVYA